MAKPSIPEDEAMFTCTAACGNTVQAKRGCSPICHNCSASGKRMRMLTETEVSVRSKHGPGLSMN